jgi:hypothetical protein
MIRQNKEALVGSLDGKIASLGTALLSFQITELENRCAAMCRRIAPAVPPNGTAIAVGYAFCNAQNYAARLPGCPLNLALCSRWDAEIVWLRISRRG